MDAKYEYDRFGPWILEINEKHGVPPLFEPWIDKNKTPGFSIKIPRDIERRKAHAGMNLYDCVINVFDNQLQILERHFDDVVAQEIRFDEITGIEVQCDLLTGYLCLYTNEKDIKIRFNTVSTDIILKLTDMIRSKYTHHPDYQEIEALSFHPPDDLSHAFFGILSRELSGDKSMKTLMTQPETVVDFSNRSVLKKIKNTVKGKKLVETMLLSNGRELVAFYRTPWFRNRKQAVYAINQLNLPIERITGVAMDKDQSADSIVRLTLSASGHAFPLLIKEDNPSLMPFIGALTAASHVELSGEKAEMTN